MGVKFDPLLGQLRTTDSSSTSALFAPRWQAALSTSHTTAIQAIFIGSSTTAGNNASPLTNRYVDTSGTLLHRYNSSSANGGRYIPAVDTSWSNSGTITNAGTGFGLNTQNMAAAATKSITVSNCDRIDIFYTQGTGAGTATITIDGTVATTITPSTSGAAGQENGQWTSSALNRGSHTILVTAVGAFGFSGMYVQDGDNTIGVRIYNSGKFGAVSGDFAADTSLWTRAATLSDVSLVLIMLGSNDYNNNVNPTTFKANLLTLINAAKSGLTTVPDFVLVNSYKRLDTSSPTYSYDQYGAVMQQLANEQSNVYYLDVSTFFPTVNSSTGDPQNLLDTDNVHLTNAGHAYMGRLIADGLTPLVRSGTFDPASSTLIGNTLTLTNGGEIGANGLTVYNTSDRITNYERFKMQYNGNVATFTSESGGSGTVRDINFVTPNRSLRIVDTGNSSGVYRMTVGSGQASSVGLALTGSYTNGSTVQTALSVSPTINQSSTGGYTAILANVTESATGSGAKRLLDLQVGSTTKFNVANDGTVTHADAANIVLGTSTGTKIGTATTQKIGFYNATPVVQQNTTGTTTGFTAGAGTTVDSAATFTGGLGGTAYTVGDVVLALKTLGLLAQ